MIDDERPDAPEEEGADQGASEQPAEQPEAEAEAPTEEQPPTEEPPAEEPPSEEQPPAQEEPAAEEQSAGDEDLSSVEDQTEEVAEAPEAAQEERPKREKPKRDGEGAKDEIIPGAHLAPDLVLEEERPEGEFGEYADADAAGYEAPAAAEAESTSEEGEPEAPAERSVLDLAADAFYQATGKRKRSVARVILRPGDGSYSVNGRSLEDYFPRAALQKAARQPLATAGFEKRMDVVARIHGGGISAQAGALRHGVARALVEADPSLRVELKRRGFLSRDARMKERKKAGLKKARKRPQFSKR